MNWKSNDKINKKERNRKKLKNLKKEQYKTKSN